MILSSDAGQNPQLLFCAKIHSRVVLKLKMRVQQSDLDKSSRYLVSFKYKFIFFPLQSFHSQLSLKTQRGLLYKTD